MQKEQIAVHTLPIKEQLPQTMPTTAIVPAFQGNTPPIVDSTIIIQDQPLPSDETEPIIDIPVCSRRRACFMFLALVLILLLSIGLYFVIPFLFPSATVTIVPMEKKLTTTATIHIVAISTQLAADKIPGRMLPSLTLSQAETVKTTGIGHQQATYAYGTITFYNGLFASQVIAAGTVLTGADGIQVITDQTAVIPADTPPINGVASVQAHALSAGSAGNIAAFDINRAVSSSVLARNTFSFYGGRDARTFPVVTQVDIDNAVTHLKPSLTQSIQGAFSTQLLPGEALITPVCVLKTVTDKNVGEEASLVQVTLSQTCQTAAYKTNDLQQTVTHLITQDAQTRFGTGYALAGDISTTLASTAITNSQQIATMSIKAASRWVYQFRTSEKQKLLTLIAGKPKQQAMHILLQRNGISHAAIVISGSYMDTLPQDQNRIQIVVMYRFV